MFFAVPLTAICPNELLTSRFVINISLPARRLPVIDTVSKALLALGAFVNITAGTNIRGDAIDPTAFPPSARKILNYVFGGLQAAILLSAIIFEDTPGAEPVWVDGLNAVLLVASGILSAVATSHVVPSPPPADESQPENVIGARLF